MRLRVSIGSRHRNDEVLDERTLQDARAEFHLEGGASVVITVDERSRTLRWTVHDRIAGGQLTGGTLVIPPT